MTAEVDLEPFHRNLGEMLVAAERCIQLGHHTPALVLIYALIDSLAWAASYGTNAGVGKRFRSWVDKWLLPELAPFAPKVTATDIYAARCAVLHTLTGDSDLSAAGRARRFLYAWGSADAKVLEQAIREANDTSVIALHCGELLTALVRAMEMFLDRANSDPSLSFRLERAAARHYVSVETKRPSMVERQVADT